MTSPENVLKFTMQFQRQFSQIMDILEWPCFTVTVQFKRKISEHWPFRSHRLHACIHTYFHSPLPMKDVSVFPPKKYQQLSTQQAVLFHKIQNAVIKWHHSQVIQTAYKCNLSLVRLPAYYRAYKQHRLLYGHFSVCVNNKEPRD